VFLKLFIRAEGFDVSDKDARNPLLYSSMLEHTKTQHRALGAVGKAAQKVIDERRAVQRSKKGEKVLSVVVARDLTMAMFCAAAVSGRLQAGRRACSVATWRAQVGAHGAILHVRRQAPQPRFAALQCGDSFASLLVKLQRIRGTACD
jgi:hypothetical protein